MAEERYSRLGRSYGARSASSAGVGWGMVFASVMIALIAIMVLFQPPTDHEPSPRNRCLSNIKQILLALQNYHDANGELPPAYSVDAEGHRLHSWRALILPYMEGDHVHELIDYTRPWDAPENERARNIPRHFYLCPSSTQEDERLTTYLAVVGPEFLFNESSPRSFADVTDGAANTIAIIEVSSDKAVHWMSPKDADESFVFENGGANLETGHPATFLAGFLDGHAEAIEVDIEAKTLRAMLTIAGHEKLD